MYPLATSTWDHEELAAISRVTDSGRFTMGHEVAAYERDFGGFFRSKRAVMSNSGSSANLLAIAAIRYSSLYQGPHRDEVIVPAVSWSTTYYPITQLGFKLKFVDIDLSTLNATPTTISEAIGPKTAGIVAVNLLGNPSRLSEISSLARDKGLFLIEDNCESMGAKLDGKFAGTFGHIGTFSSFFSHHISTMEGGISLTDNEELAQVMTSLRAHGWTRELPEENFVYSKSGDAFDDLYRFVLPGYNVRPIEFEGAIGQAQLRKLPAIIEGRKANAKIFQGILADYPFLTTQFEVGESSWFGFSMILDANLTAGRQSLLGIFQRHGIEARPVVAGNFTRNPVLKHLAHTEMGTFRNADIVHDSGLFIGNHHYPMDREFEALQAALEEFLQLHA